MPNRSTIFTYCMLGHCARRRPQIVLVVLIVSPIGRLPTVLLLSLQLPPGVPALLPAPSLLPSPWIANNSHVLWPPYRHHVITQPASKPHLARSSLGQVHHAVSNIRAQPVWSRYRAAHSRRNVPSQARKRASFFLMRPGVGLHERKGFAPRCFPRRFAIRASLDLYTPAYTLICTQLCTATAAKSMHSIHARALSSKLMLPL